VWLALTSIVLASAIGFNVIALWLTAWFERRQPESPSYTERNTNADIRQFLVIERKGQPMCVRCRALGCRHRIFWGLWIRQLCLRLGQGAGNVADRITGAGMAGPSVLRRSKLPDQVEVRFGRPACAAKVQEPVQHRRLSRVMCRVQIDMM
jgi:hypothetical protein